MESDIFSYSPEIFEKVYKEIYSQIFQVDCRINLNN